MVPMTQEYPDDSLAHLKVGRLLGQLGDYTRCRTIASARHCAWRPDKAEARYLLSLVFLMEGQDEARRGDQERARTLFQQAVALVQ